MPKKPMYIAEATVEHEQRDILNKRLDHSHLVVGCAGSGKSCLALLRIKTLSQMKDAAPFYLVTFVRSLVEYLRRELSANILPGKCVLTHKEWTEGRITDWCGRRFGIPPEHRQLCKVPNYLLVDECQDLPLDDIRQMKTATQRAIFLYGDDEQQIMGFTDRRPATIEQIGAELNLPIYRLRLNYRLPKKVASFAQEISGSADLERHCVNGDGNKPCVISVPTPDRIALIVKLVEQNHYEDVGILCRTDEQVRQAFKELNKKHVSVSARYSVDDGDFQYLTDTPFKVMNFHQAKGQQFEAVFLLLEHKVTYDRNVLYVGVTRTYHDLYVIYEGILPEPLRAIPLDRYRSSLAQLEQPLIQV